jgi:hypothetical protein
MVASWPKVIFDQMAAPVPEIMDQPSYMCFQLLYVVVCAVVKHAVIDMGSATCLWQF